MTLAAEAEEEVPPAYISRRTSFKEKLEKIIGNEYTFHVIEKNTEHVKKTVMVPKSFAHIPITNILQESEDEFEIPRYDEGNDSLMSLIHVAMK